MFDISSMTSVTVSVPFLAATKCEDPRNPKCEHKGPGSGANPSSYNKPHTSMVTEINQHRSTVGFIQRRFFSMPEQLDFVVGLLPSGHVVGVSSWCNG